MLFTHFVSALFFGSVAKELSSFAYLVSLLLTLISIYALGRSILSVNFKGGFWSKSFSWPSVLDISVASTSLPA